MDPNTTLNRMRKLLRRIQNDDPLDMDEVVEFLQLFEALDTWLAKGGFLPRAWNKPTRTK